jgi:large subunit ribosomal protein L6
MSYLGRKPIKVPSNVNIKVSNGFVQITGPLGSLSRQLDENIRIELGSDELSVLKPTNSKNKSIWGLTRSLLANMIEGVSQGFTVQLQMIGVGYKADVNGDLLSLKLGFSHSIELEIPNGIKVSLAKSNRNNLLILSGIDNEKITSFAAKIRDFRRPEPYKGKGLSYLNEEIRRKEGKKK